MSDADDILTRIRAVLADASGAVWNNAQLTEALNQAFTDFRMKAGQQMLLNGLNGEPNTTNFANYYFSLLVRGAVGYALLGRAAERAHAFNYDQDLSAAAIAAGKVNLEQFEKGLQDLKKIRLTALQASEEAPFPIEGDSSWEKSA